MAEANLLTQKRLIQKKGIDLTATINGIEIGESIVLTSKQAKSSVIRNTCRRIAAARKKTFTVTEKGMVDSTLIIRTM